MGSAVLAFAMIYGRVLSPGPNALGWWAAGYSVQTLSYLLLLGNPDATVRLWMSDLLHGLMAMLVLMGALTFLERRIGQLWMILGIGASVAWAVVAVWLRDIFALPPLPMFGLGTVPLLLAAWAFLANRPGYANDGHLVTAGSFALSGVHELIAPILHAHEALAPWSFVLAQITAIITALSLLVVTLRRQQAQAAEQTGRANLVQTRFMEAIESISEGFVLYDAEDRMVLCNSKYREMLSPIAAHLVPGISFPQILNLCLEHGVIVVPPHEQTSWLRASVRRHLQPSGPYTLELADGRHILSREYRTRDGGIVAIRTDVTESRLAEQAMRESEQRLRGIMDTVVDGIITINARGIVQSFNPAAERFFGYRADEVVGRNIAMLMPEPHSGAHDGYMDSYLRTGEARIIGTGRQVEGRRKDGSIFPVDLSVSELRRGNQLTFIGVVRDITDRKRVEEALLDSEQRFRDLAEAASDWFWECNEHLQFTFVSSRVRQVMGVKTAFFIGRTFGDLKALSGQDEAGWADQLDLMADQRAFRDFAFRQQLPDGSVKFVKISGRPVFDAGNQFKGYRGTATDITSEVQAKAEAEKAQAQLMAALESISEGFVLWDADDRMVLCNSNYRSMFEGVPVAVEPGVAFRQLVEAVAAAGVLVPAQAELDGWVEARVSHHRNPSGSVQMQFASGRWVLANERQTKDGYVVGVYTDVTPLKRRETEVARQTERLQAIIDNMPLGVSVFDADYRLVAFNRQAQDLFALPPALVRPGRFTYADFLRLLAERGEFGPGDPAQLAAERLDRMRRGAPLQSERVRPDGTAVEIRRSSMPDGGFLATYSDITERKRAERILRDAKDAAERGNRAKAAFLASISHELRTPLNAIIGFSEAMIGELFGPIGNGKYQDYLSDIHDSGRHLLNLINDILDMSKAEAGKIELYETQVDIARAVDSARRLVIKRAESAKVALAVRIPRSLPPLLADERRLKQILLNLLSNAVKFTDEGGSITVSAWTDPNGYCIEVADTGIGMKPDDLSKAMEPFAQVDSSLSRKYEGTGLGLPLTKALVEAHGGQLLLSSSFGVGTTALVRMPSHRIGREDTLAETESLG